MLSLFSILITSNGVDTITTTKPLADGETLISSGGICELGFFSPRNSTNRYVGIWYRTLYYKEISRTSVLWVANRETPLFDTSGVLKLTIRGILVLVNGTNGTIWSTNASRSAQDPVAQLFDNGNMVVRNADDELRAVNFLWQSFDYPGNTLLSGMKLGKNFLTGQEWYISSWKSEDDPGEGAFTFVLDTHGYPQMFLRKGTADYLYGSGPWNGLRFSGISDSNLIFRFNYDLRPNYDLNTEEVYYTFDVPNASVATRTVLSSEGYVGQWTWVDQTRGWIAMARAPEASCDIYASCGSYGICNIGNTSMCGCLDKFVPVNPREWELGEWSNGCVRRTPLGCPEGGEDGFVKYSRVKLPDTRNSSFNIRMSLEECRRTCLGNCSCTAYANLDIRDAGSGCLLWFGNLIDIKEFIEEGGQDMYVRMASSESGYVNPTPRGRSVRWKWIITALAVSMTLLTTAFFYCILWRKLKKKDTITTTKPLADGETLISSGGIYELGFFSPGNSTNRYVGIWYMTIYNKEIPRTAVVWVANRETPLFDKSGVLKLTSRGILILVNGTNGTIWSTNTSRSAQDPVAQLFDDGRMVVRNAVDEVRAVNFLWQSFDYPGNTLLSGMKLGKNFLTGQEWYISSWKSEDDPGEGAFTFVLDTHGYPQMFLRKGTADYLYGSGPWNGLRFSGISDSNLIFRFNYDLRPNYDLNTEEVYYTFNVPDASVATRTVLSSEGYVGQWTWVDQTRGWIAMARAPEASCDMYVSCGSYGICNIGNTSMCGCLDKFVPVNPREWELGEWSNGCVRRTPLGCPEGGEDGFVKYSRVKLPDTRNSSFNIRMSLEECRRTCLGNCSCTAYANLDIRDAGSGCLLWFGNLIDIKEFIEEGGQDMYVRMASSESGYVNPTPRGRSVRWKWIITALAVSMTLLTTAFFYCILWRKLQKKVLVLLWVVFAIVVEELSRAAVDVVFTQTYFVTVVELRSLQVLLEEASCTNPFGVHQGISTPRECPNENEAKFQQRLAVQIASFGVLDKSEDGAKKSPSSHLGNNPQINVATDTITTTKPLADGETLISLGGHFELGFFSPGNSTNRYVGIWYRTIYNKEIPRTAVVWVANRETPLFDKSGVLKLTSRGILILVNGTNGTIWSTNTSRSAQDPVAQLFDDGNMVVRNADDEVRAVNLLWQSFDYPGNTLLPGMKLGKNFLTGQEWHISSWKSDDDPGEGAFTFVLDTRGYPQMFLRKGTADYLYGSGPWNGVQFSGISDSDPIFRFNYRLRLNYDLNTEEVYYTFASPNITVAARTVLSSEGYVEQLTWVDHTRGWIAMARAPEASCDRYASCGSYGICNIGNPSMCGCLDKFVPVNPREWELGVWSNGCVRRMPLGCPEGGEDGFVKYSRVKLPDTRNSSFNIRLSLEECRRTCLGNCSCTAYVNLDIRDAGSGCLLWFGNLIDVKEFIEEGGQDIYVRMASSESGYVNPTPRGRSMRWKWIITALVVSMTLLTTAFFYCILRRKLQKKGFRIWACITSGKDLLSYDLGTDNGAGNSTLTQANTITTTKSLADGETIVSSSGLFELGFFSPGNSTNRYVGIWYRALYYKEIPKTAVVWVANRETPLFDTSGVLKLTSRGILVLVNGTNDTIWSTNASRSAQDPAAQLFDSGNMVVRNADDEGTADYLYGSGPWNGVQFSGISDSNPIFRFNYGLRLNYDLNTEEVYYTFDVPNASVATRTVLSSEGYVGQWTWVDQTRGWIALARAPEASCDMYASCGSYGICNIGNTSMCGCLDKFVPVNPREWELDQWSNGCVRRTPLGCPEGGEDGFVKYSRVKLPDTRNSSFDTRMSLEECRRTC
ncbi:hypothetical protein RHGRI_009551 [Rhododendron griersonianum]|uniref:S-locus glycoprotein n=1 Tax=Rhododendron griersonianum TaxID=479676 RepID=A0AAV6KF86_9ERIC|nr:hypothetical protein RHGRI_009551 [Rhododendron griersonianum]